MSIAATHSEGNGLTTSMIPYALAIAWLLPLGGFAVLVFFGRRIGEPKAGILASGLMIAAAAIVVACGIDWLRLYAGASAALSLRIPWLYIGW